MRLLLLLVIVAFNFAIWGGLIWMGATIVKWVMGW